ncbi:MAG: RdgB/HAM1 family non-canonical purine NTP pyrophosphatase [Verrucomicrobiales bacterium]|jgi:XTP/dITP diphosphohydrolase|nr:RdgB/HAM1 family non-canonical purine NTP pyrophosphatase [Verrucomicrobiales bacterium]
MREILLATGNAKKGRELAQLLGEGWAVRTLRDLPSAPAIIEDGLTFEANAVKKALTLAASSSGLILADDSGLEVDALGGAPGIFSARYAGEPADDARNNALLLDRLATVSDAARGAQFRCVLALAADGQLLRTFEGICRGRLLRAPRGANGFGYDPLFVPDGYAESFAELPAAVKHEVSHRGKAMRQLFEYLKMQNSKCKMQNCN